MTRAMDYKHICDTTLESLTNAVSGSAAVTMDRQRSATAPGDPVVSGSSTRTYASPTRQHEDHAELPPASNAAATAAAALSAEQPPTPDSIANGRKRKASGVPGSRGVANLTAEQLAKKRANDRQAQKAIRERTRSTIESLERRIRELEGQQPFQELQRAIQDRDRALADCEEYRRRLTSIASIVEVVQHQPSLSELATLTAQQTPLPLPQHHTSPPPPPPPSHQSQGQTFLSSAGPAYEHQSLHPELPSPNSTTHASSPTQADPSIPIHQQGHRSLFKWAAGQDRPSGHSYPPLPQLNGTHYDLHSPATAPAQPTHSSHGDRLELNFLLDPSSRQPQTRTSSSPSNNHHPPLTRDPIPVHARTSLIGPSSCPLDSLLIDFHNSRRQMMRDGTPALEAVGPAYPFFATMINPDLQHQGNCHPLSSLILDILSKFPDISRRPEKVAVYFIMFLVMQWTICPCERCYERLPEWCRPVPEQCERSHAAWADYLPWPSMRRQLCCDPVKFDDFFVPYTTTVSLNWPHSPDNVLRSIPRTDTDGPPDVIIDPTFELHLRDLRNWSLGSRFRDALPQLVDHTVTIRDSK